jgi:hypothetical protein
MACLPPVTVAQNTCNCESCPCKLVPMGQCHHVPTLQQNVPQQNKDLTTNATVSVLQKNVSCSWSILEKPNVSAQQTVPPVQQTVPPVKQNSTPTTSIEAANKIIQVAQEATLLKTTLNQAKMAADNAVTFSETKQRELDDLLLSVNVKQLEVNNAKKEAKRKIIVENEVIKSLNSNKEMMKELKNIQFQLEIQEKHKDEEEVKESDAMIFARKNRINTEPKSNE